MSNYLNFYFLVIITVIFFYLCLLYLICKCNCICKIQINPCYDNETNLEEMKEYEVCI